MKPSKGGKGLAHSDVYAEGIYLLSLRNFIKGRMPSISNILPICLRSADAWEANLLINSSLARATSVSVNIRQD